MELKEAIAVLKADLQNEKENYCKGVEHEPAQTGPNLIDGLTGTPTPDNLLRNMEKHKKRSGSPHIPTLPPKKGTSSLWDIEKCDQQTFPWQTHHLIPKKFLPEQSVCVWLTAAYTKHPVYQLAADTKYSTDHSNNGYCLPFVSTCHQWQRAQNERAKADAAFLMMKKTKKQLHQGNHSKQEFDEQDEIELEAYLDSIKALLKRIHDAGVVHVNTCSECKKGGKKQVQPLDALVDQVDTVSLITKLRIDANKIFVSQRAYEFHKANR